MVFVFLLHIFCPPKCAFPSFHFAETIEFSQYKMKFVYAHFPINYNVTDGPTGKNTVLEIRNFIGEKLTRRITMQKGCIVERTANKDEIAITGNDLDMVSISAAQVWSSLSYDVAALSSSCRFSNPPSPKTAICVSFWTAFTSVSASFLESKCLIDDRLMVQ